MKTFSNTEINNIVELANVSHDKSDKDLRIGQQIYNITSITYPMFTESVNGNTDIDCFYKDENIDRFLTELEKYLNNCTKDVKEPFIKIRRIVDWSVAMECALFTVNKDYSGKEPTDAWKDAACKAEHSMLREVRYVLEMHDIPSWVSQHIARHDAFCNHNVRESKEIHYVGTSRSDRTGIDRNKLPQDAPVNHKISLSAQDFITISKLRLCNCAHAETRKVWQAVIKELEKIDPMVARNCVSTCVYRGFCPEFKGGCGYANSVKFDNKVKEYRSKIKNI